MRLPGRSTLLLLGATSCGSCKHAGSADGGAPAAVDAAVRAASSAPLSLPMTADVDPSGRVWVVGLVAARSAANVSLFDDAGHLVWNVDALDGLTYSSDAQIDVVAATHGAVVVWRGIRAGKRTRVARWIADDATPAPQTFDVGASACAAGGDLYWIASKGGGTVMTRHLPSGQESAVYVLGDGVDPTLVCGEQRRAWVVEDYEDGLRARPIADGKPLPRSPLVSEDDLGDDDVRDHDEATSHDALDEIVLTEKGHLLVRHVDEAGAGPKRTLEHVLGAEEGLMAFDGDAARTVALVARDASGRCDGELATDVVAIDVPRAPDAPERLVDVAHADCGKDLGPYWVGPTTDAMLVAWAVRGPRVGVRAPVEALVWSKLGETPTSVSLSAEDVAFAGCHAQHCAFAALVRPEGTDGMTPGEARVIVIP